MTILVLGRVVWIVETCTVCSVHCCGSRVWVGFRSDICGGLFWDDFKVWLVLVVVVFVACRL